MPDAHKRQPYPGFGLTNNTATDTQDAAVTGKPKKRSSLREQQRAQRKALILQAAYTLLVEKGYYEMSMDEIAVQVGISKGTLYLHFESKEELVFLLIEQEIVKFLALVDEVIEQEIAVRAKLEYILLETYRSIESGRQFLLALRAIGLHRGVIRERLEEQVTMQGLLDRLSTLFEEGKRTGEFDGSIPTPIMVSMFLGLMEMYDNEQLVTASQLSPESFVQFVGHVFFQGLLTLS